MSIYINKKSIINKNISEYYIDLIVILISNINTIKTII